ncbi:MAG: hypothetical protein HYT87_16640 [Nitrospirae bacterium]|nr:hypothetical protein [Nitrospirota bacterium]
MTIPTVIFWAITQITYPLVEAEHFGVDLDLDAYYSAVAAYASIGTARPEFGEGEEGEIYKYLWANFLKPHTILFEASTYPMPLAGIALKANTGDRYGEPPAAVGDNPRDDPSIRPKSRTSIAEILTAGFEEPYAFSLFAGNLASFKSPVPSVKGIAYAGYLFTFGTQHIKSNSLIDTRWYEFEGKLKGDDIKIYRKLKWSYRIGGRVFQDPEISNYVYFSTLRDRIDFTGKGWSLLRNSFLEVSGFASPTVSTKVEDVLVRALAIVGKNFPFYKDKLTFSFGLGVVINTSAKYKGCLKLDTGALTSPETRALISQCRELRTDTPEGLSARDDFISSHSKKFDLQLAVRPNLKF